MMPSLKQPNVLYQQGCHTQTSSMLLSWEHLALAHKALPLDLTVNHLTAHTGLLA
jgi:hypothetical protein